MKSAEVLLITPVYNEITTLPDFYRGLRVFWAGDILFVDDGSDDGSNDFLKKLSGSRVKVIQHASRMGYGKALLDGFEFARSFGYNAVITIDADLQHDPRHIRNFLDGLESFPVVLGSRYMRITDVPKVPFRVLDVPRDRLVINRRIRSFINSLFNINFSDPFCGYRAYNRFFLEKAVLEESGYGLALEILLEIIRTGVRFMEVPVDMIYRENKKFLDGLDDPQKRFSYYLEVISRKKEFLEYETLMPTSRPVCVQARTGRHKGE